MSRSRAHGYVSKVGPTWYSRVRDSDGKCVFEDDTNDWRVVFDACIEDVAVARRVENSGHQFSCSFADLVAREDAA